MLVSLSSLLLFFFETGFQFTKHEIVGIPERRPPHVWLVEAKEEQNRLIANAGGKKNILQRHKEEERMGQQQSQQGGAPGGQRRENDKKPGEGEKKEKKPFEPYTPPAGGKKKARKGGEAATKIPVGKHCISCLSILSVHLHHYRSRSSVPSFLFFFGASLGP